MKKIPFILAILFFTVKAGAQVLKESQVPAGVKNAFTIKYPDTAVKWEKEDGNYEASFKLSGNNMSCVIDKNGSILETETTISESGLPANVKAYIKNNYPAASIRESAKIVKANGDLIYEAQVNKMDLLFDSNGIFIKSEKE